MQRVAVICLGAFGDCCNALPIALHEFQQDNNVTFYISREFESLLDGVTYCEKAVVDTHYSNCLQVAEQAELTGLYDRILIVQCYGTSIERQTDSYCKEAWRAVGKLHLWGKLPLVFDNRDTSQKGLCYDGVPDDKRNLPILLVSHSGKSSPFPFVPQLLQLIEPLKEKFLIADISHYQCPHFYDLISIYEKAACLIATDSGPLHLANAVPKLPVISLITDKPDLWHGSPPQPNHVLRIRYSEFPSTQAAGRISDTLMRLALKEKVERRIVHVWNDYPYRAQDANYRHEIADESWDAEYKKGRWLTCPVPDSQLSRNAQSIGESKPFPFVNDLIEIAASQAQPDDLICLTNDDTIFVNDLTERLLRTEPPFWSSRWEHSKVPGSLDPITIKKNAWKHVGADIFVFTKRWWMEHRSEFPDMLVACEAWDLVLRTLINLTGGHEEDALCAHIIHQPEWHSAEQRERVSNLFNRDAARSFFRNHNMTWPQV